MQRCLYVKRQRVRGPETERIHHGVKPGKIRLLNREDIFMNHMLCRRSGAAANEGGDFKAAGECFRNNMAAGLTIGADNCNSNHGDRFP